MASTTNHTGLAPHSTGLLLGWTSVASVVNAFAVRRRGRFAATTRTGRAASNVALAGTAVALTAGIAASRRGYLSMAAAGTWALTTSALNPERMPRTRAISALGATLIATTAAAKLFRRRRRK